MNSFKFTSTKALEQMLNGADENYMRYYFALYQCSPDELGGINDLREQLRIQHPDKAIPVGRYFILVGEPAFIALNSYYHALAAAETLSESYRGYVARCIDNIKTKHDRSQGLPVPIDLTEGELAHDDELELLTCTAIMRGQVRNDNG